MASNVRVEEEDDRLEIYFPYNEDCKDDLKSELSARWNPDLKCWWVSSDDYTIQDVEKILKMHFPGAFR